MSKINAIRIFTVLMLVSLPFLGSDCEDVIKQVTQEPCTGGDITGNWVYIYNAGTLLDICPGEIINFPNNTGGTATLTCPNQSGITRNYTVSGQTLTYSETSMQYQICFDNQGHLVLNGINNNRILYYSSSISDKPVSSNSDTYKNTLTNNSSEINR